MFPPQQPLYQHYIGIDYSGAQASDTGIKGLRVYAASGTTPPSEVLPSSPRHRFWSRRALAYWLLEQLNTNQPTIIGIDHGFSFPLQYFEAHSLEKYWPEFLKDFQHHWPTDLQKTSVQQIRDHQLGNGQARQGNSRWRRLVEVRARAKSVFHFDVPGSVAKSTHAGLPWLHFLRSRVTAPLHFWPYDGWQPSMGHSLITEIYPSLWNKLYPHQNRTPDQHDAYVATRWLQETDQKRELPRYLHPELTLEEEQIARFEGWILGVL
nr:hypothetical protein [uncultured Desulfobulbus sp.]